MKIAETTSKVNDDAMAAAILAVKRNKSNVLVAARANGIPKTSLYRQIEKEDKNNYNKCWKPCETKRTAKNFIACSVCKAPFLLECVCKSLYGRIYVCKNCDSEYSFGLDDD